MIKPYILCLILLSNSGLLAQLTPPTRPIAKYENPAFRKNARRTIDDETKYGFKYSSIAEYDEKGQLKKYIAIANSPEKNEIEHTEEYKRDENGRVYEETIHHVEGGKSQYHYTYSENGIVVEKIGLDVSEGKKDTIAHEKVITTAMSDSTYLMRRMTFEFSHLEYIDYNLRSDDDLFGSMKHKGKDEWIVFSESKLIVRPNQLLEATVDGNINAWTMDEQGRVISLEIWHKNKQADRQLMSYKYQDGRLSKEEFKRFENSIVKHEERTFYDYFENGNIKKVETFGDRLNTISFEYDSQNRLIKRRDCNKKGECDQRTYHYE